MIEHPRHDYYADTFEEIDGKFYVYNSVAPNKRFEVTLLDSAGDEVDNEDLAVGGIVKLADDCYTTFLFQDAGILLQDADYSPT